MALHPVGPLPASTYWRRRIGLVVGLLVLLLVLKSCAGSGNPSPRAGVKPTPSPTASAAPRATSKPSGKPTTQPTTAPVTATAPLCADSALALVTTTDAQAYAVGGTPKITLAVKNTSSAPCRRDLGSGAVELIVLSGADRIWSSDDCSLGKAASLVTLAPGASQTILKTWPGKRSLPGCAGSKATAAAGTYKVVGRVGSLRRDGAVFRLQA